jgi:hypothetical protein
MAGRHSCLNRPRSLQSIHPFFFLPVRLRVEPQGTRKVKFLGGQVRSAGTYWPTARPRCRFTRYRSHRSGATRCGSCSLRHNMLFLSQCALQRHLGYLCEQEMRRGLGTISAIPNR